MQVESLDTISEVDMVSSDEELKKIFFHLFYFRSITQKCELRFGGECLGCKPGLNEIRNF